jgi:hypothetical protein
MSTISGNAGVVGATVECVPVSFNSLSPQILFLTSDSLGNYSFTGILVGSYYLTAFASGFVYRKRALVVVDGVNNNSDVNLVPAALNSSNA